MLEINAMKRQIVESIKAESIRNLAEVKANAFKTKVMQEAIAYREKIVTEANKEATIIR